AGASFAGPELWWPPGIPVGAMSVQGITADYLHAESPKLIDAGKGDRGWLFQMVDHATPVGAVDYQALDRMVELAPVTMQDGVPVSVQATLAPAPTTE